ncbi:MAG: AAA family ATPase [Deltaproteobacteria bacterium]|nr:AAA family ATPase [Deltaproteobacteria bacterium]
MVSIKKRNCEIWAIGGGKGGVGKSFIISSMGNYLASKGKKVVLIDADFGGANLHTFLGISKPKVTLTDFFDNKLPLNELIVDSSIPNLGLLIGTIRSLAPDSIKYTQKLKLFRHVEGLDTDYILIDLGGGTHFNTIDTFLLADKMLIAIVPEIIAIENVYYFLKNILFRKLVNAFGAHGLKHVVRDAWQNRGEHNVKNFRQLIDHLRGMSDPIRQIINEELSSFTIYIILNQIRTSEDVMVGNSVKSICIKYFGLNTQYIGYVEYDDFISRCINKRQAYMETYPTSRCAKEIERLTENLLEGRQLGIKT